MCIFLVAQSKYIKHVHSHLFCHSILMVNTRVSLDRIPLATSCSTTVMYYVTISLMLWHEAQNFFKKTKTILSITDRFLSIIVITYFAFCVFHFSRLLYVWPLDCLVCTQTLAGLAIYKDLKRQITARAWREPN